MNIAYFIYHGVYYENDMFDVCIRSLKKQSDCEIYVYTPTLENQELLKHRGVNVIDFPMSEWEDRRMTCKVEKVKDLMSKLDTGDNLMCFDSDLIFLKNPFDVFDNDFDFMYTTRHYAYEYRANGGVWGVKVNERSKKFLEYYVSNLNNPSWPPYETFRLTHTYNSDIENRDWWVDQDFLCVCNHLKEQINNGSLGFDITIFDATSKYNYIITGGQKEIGHQIEFGDNYILHLKGGAFGRWETQGTTENVKKQELAYETYFKNFLEESVMSEKYIATGGGGIGNQIKKLVSAKRLHPNSQTDLGYFNDLFENQELHHNGNRSGQDCNTWRFIVLPQDIEIPVGFNVHTTGDEVIGQGFTWHDPYSHWSFNEDGRNVDCEYLRIPTTYRNKILKIFEDYLTVHPGIQYCVDEFKKEYNKFSSVHLRSYNADGFVKNGANRGGDINPRAQARHQYWNEIQRNQFLEYVNQLNEDVVYVSSDNRLEIETLKNSCPTKKFIHYTDVYEKPYESDYSNDFLDMILLSQGIEMVLCRISTYSEVAWFFSKCNENIKVY